MITVAEAERLILEEIQDYGNEVIPFMEAVGRTLARPLLADRDFPPFNRVSMDGIAIRYDDYANGVRQFRVSGTVGAGEQGPATLEPGSCLEIMTGAALPSAADTVIQYEHLEIENGMAVVVKEPVKPGQNIHRRGSDQLAGTVLTPAGKRLTAFDMSVAASVGAGFLEVKKNPRVALFSSGNELVEVQTLPNDFQIRRSNVYVIDAFLRSYGMRAELIHLPDNEDIIRKLLSSALENFDVLLLSGGVSAGKFDFIPDMLQECGVKRLFHKVQQRPGKPLWFGAFGKQGVVFAFPGNPVSTFLCLLRYFQPWLQGCFGAAPAIPRYARLTHDFVFEPALAMFLPVKIEQAHDAALLATAVEYHGSGDYAALLQADGFLELPMENRFFTAGTVARFWEFPRQ